MLVAAWLLAFVGVVAIAMTNQATSRLVIGSTPSTRRRRWGAVWGSAALSLCLILTVTCDGPELGLLLGPLLIASATAIVIGLLTIKPRLFRPIARLLDW